LKKGDWGTPLILRRVYDQTLGIRLRRTAPLHTLGGSCQGAIQRPYGTTVRPDAQRGRIPWTILDKVEPEAFKNKEKRVGVLPTRHLYPLATRLSR
jgi:hypothetical protein